MLLAYLLLFLLHLSSSACTCHATSRNHHLFFGVSTPGAPSPAVHDHRRITKVLSYGDAQNIYGMMARRGAATPLPSLSGADDMRPPDTEISVAMAPLPSPSPSPPPEVNNGGYGEGQLRGGGDVSGGDGEGAPPSDATDLEESVAVDYLEPRTHPPSHN